LSTGEWSERIASEGGICTNDPMLQKLRTSSSAIAERTRHRVGKFWPKYKWKMIFCIKRCQCRTTNSTDLFTWYPNSDLAALRKHQFSSMLK